MEREAFFETCCHEHRRSLHRFAFRMLGDGDEAADILQETFLRLHDHLQNGKRSIENPRAWLFQIAGNLCRDRLRRDGTFRRLFHRESSMPPAAASSEEEMERVESRARVRRALNGLAALAVLGGGILREKAETGAAANPEPAEKPVTILAVTSSEGTQQWTLPLDLSEYRPVKDPKIVVFKEESDEKQSI